MAYYQTYPLSGNPVRALEVLRDYFIHNGFELTELTSTGFKARRPPRTANMQQHNPLAMIREVTVESMGMTLTLNARTGGGKTAMAVVLAIVFLVFGIIALVALKEFHDTKHAPFPWPVLGVPVILAGVFAAVFGTLNKTAKRLLDVAAANAAMVAEHEAAGGGRR